MKRKKSRTFDSLIRGFSINHCWSWFLMFFFSPYCIRALKNANLWWIKEVFLLSIWLENFSMLGNFNQINLPHNAQHNFLFFPLSRDVFFFFFVFQKEDELKNWRTAWWSECSVERKWKEQSMKLFVRFSIFHEMLLHLVLKEKMWKCNEIWRKLQIDSALA